MRRLSPFLISFCLLVVLIPTTALAAPSFDKSVNTLLAKGYPQKIEKYLTSLGTNPDLGFRWAGTSADNAAAKHLAQQMRAMGLVNVRLEPVPVDVFEFTHADVTVGDKVMMASTYIGVPPTPPEGITAPVVYVGRGTAVDYLTAGDVTGKLVLVDMAMSSWWVNLPGFEAWVRGAKGVIVTYSDADTKYYSVSPDALGSFDGYYDFAAPPMVYVSKNSGDWLKGQLTAGPVTATLTLNEKVKLASNGGRGYNVVGMLPGTKHDGQLVVIAAHHDCHFRAGIDDTGGTVNMMMIAKAMKMSGYKPQHTIVFLGTTGEEGAYTNAYYDWCIGAWWAATRAHKNWPGHMRALLNLESMAQTGGALGMTTNDELKAWLEGLATANTALLPNGSSVEAPPFAWNDLWTFAAAGADGITFGATNDAVNDPLYHSNFETSALMDWGYLGKIAKFVFRVERSIDVKLLPYNFKDRADTLAASVDKAALVAAGADAGLAGELASAVTAFQAAAAAYQADSALIPVAKFAAVNKVLLSVQKTLNSNLIAITPFDPTVYPHEQVLKDLQGLNSAIAALDQATPDENAALDALGGVYLTWYGINFSYPTYRMEIRHHDPTYYNINWGGQGQLPDPLDIMPEYRMIEGGEYEGALIGLNLKREPQVIELNARLARMAATLETVTPRITALP